MCGWANVKQFCPPCQISVFLVNGFKISGRVQLTQAGPAAKQPSTTLDDTAQKVVTEIHRFVEVKVLANEKNSSTINDEAATFQQKESSLNLFLVLLRMVLSSKTVNPKTRTSFP